MTVREMCCELDARIAPAMTGQYMASRFRGNDWVAAADDGFAIASDHFSRRLHALVRAMAAFYLNGCVADAEPLVKLLACADQ